MHWGVQAAVAPPSNQAYCYHLVTETSLSDPLPTATTTTAAKTNTAATVLKLVQPIAILNTTVLSFKTDLQPDMRQPS